MKIYQWSTQTAARQSALLARPALEQTDRLTATRAIIEQVRADGDQALLELTRQFDGCEPRSLEVDQETIEAARAGTATSVMAAIEDAAARIKMFHGIDVPASREIETAPGLRCAVRYQPLDPVGLYVPGGTAPLVSTILMLAIPARLAGCNEIVLCTPPGGDGAVPEPILAASAYCGIKRVFAVGGAQAIAAMGLIVFFHFVPM